MALQALAVGRKSKLVRFSVVCGCVFASLAFASQAVASRPHEFKGVFGGKCLAEPCTGESLKKPAGVAVDEESGDVYAVDEGANRVARFDAEGHFLSEFNGSGLLSGEAHAAGGLGHAGEVETGRFAEPQEIAVDNSCFLRKLTKAECEAQDPSSGDVYVVDAGIGHRVIDKYSPAGEYLGQIVEGEEGGVVKRFGRALDGVAVDLAGDVWVYQETRALQKYDDKAQNAFLGMKEIPLPCCGEPGFAVDALGNFYVSHGEEVSRRIAKADSTGKVLKEDLLGADVRSVAADQVTGNALIDTRTSVAVLSPDIEEVETLDEGHLSEAAGIGVDSTSGSLYVGDDGAAASAVVVFGLAQPSTPKVEDESFANVTSHSASVRAQINPRSEEGEEVEGKLNETGYRFEYGRCLTATSCEGSGYEASAPVPPGQLSPDFESHAVSVTLEGLQPGSTYHFRARASNGHGDGRPGGEEVLTTQAAGGPLTLPDARGWELVSPPVKLGAQLEPISEIGVVQAAARGGAVTYLANAPTEPEPPGYSNEVQVLSRRTAAAWSTRDIAIPHTSPTGLANGPGPEYKFFDPELDLSAVQPFGEFVPQLSEEASEPTAYLRDLAEGCASGCFHPLVTGKPGVANVPEGTRFGEEESCPAGNHIACGPQFLGASEDLSHVVLRSSAALTTGAIGGELYEWSSGRLAQVSVLPDGTPSPPPNGLGDEGQGAARRAISSDGTRIVWEAHGALYLRDVAREETVQLDEAEAECKAKARCASGGGRFQIASADGSRVFFTDAQRLREDSGAEPATGLADLYECAIAVRAGKLSCELSDLTPARGLEAAAVQGSVLGGSEDGSYVYFVAKGIESEAAGAGGHAIAGRPNLYVRRGASTEFIATLAGGDETDWDLLAGTPESLQSQPTRVSANGRYLELMSEAQLTGYDNRDAATGKPAAEVYLYDAASGGLACASCEPSGARPVGVEYHKLEPGSGGLVGGPRDIWPAASLVAANVPGWTAMLLGQSRHQPRYLSNAGRLFFDSADALVPQDTNGTQDVYEYEPPGVGNCSKAAETYSARSGGCVALISSGSSPQESAFLDASESGDDVFFLTSARLSPPDADNARDVYDAHVCTGEPCITYRPSEETGCEGESECRPPLRPAPQIYGAPASATFPSTGNVAPATPSTTPHRSAEQIRLERLRKALKACRAKKRKQRRKACERAARKRYAKPAKRARKAKRRRR